MHGRTVVDAKVISRERQRERAEERGKGEEKQTKSAPPPPPAFLQSVKVSINPSVPITEQHEEKNNRRGGGVGGHGHRANEVTTFTLKCGQHTTLHTNAFCFLLESDMRVQVCAWKWITKTEMLLNSEMQ